LTKHDNSSLVAISDVPAALGLLSRLPVRVDMDRATARGGRAAWAYPVAGLALALIACAVAQITLMLGLPAPLAAGLALATLVITTGAMHEDGLADSADGLWGGWDKDHRLKIMKDSHIGVYGVVAIGLSLILQVSLLASALGNAPLVLLGAGIGALSRAPMVGLMHWLPNARGDGLSSSVGTPPAMATYLALGIGGVIGLGILGLFPVILVAAAALIWALIAKSKIGGQTGDILGATQQLAMIFALIGLAS